MKEGAFQFQGEIRENTEDGTRDGRKQKGKMKRSRAQIKADLLKRYVEEVDQLLDWQEKSYVPNLMEFEDEILAARKKVSIALLEAMLAGEEQRAQVAAPRCPKYGEAMEAKGKQPQVIETRVGTLRLCDLQSGSFFPWIGSSSLRNTKPSSFRRSAVLSGTFADRWHSAYYATRIGSTPGQGQRSISLMRAL
jgi:hypothetical protein